MKSYITAIIYLTVTYTFSINVATFYSTVLKLFLIEFIKLTVSASSSLFLFFI